MKPESIKKLGLLLVSLALLSSCSQSSGNSSAASSSDSSTSDTSISSDSSGSETSSGESSGQSSEEEKTPLAAPVIALEGYTLSWSAVENATSYEIYFGDTLSKTVTTTSAELDTSTPGTYAVTVIAKTTAEGYTDSEKSNEVSFVVPDSLAAPTLTLTDKTVSWEAVPGAYTYMVFLNGSYVAEQTETSYEISATDIGAYSITVRSCFGDQLSESSEPIAYKILPSVVATATSWDRDGLYGDDWIRTGDFDTGVGEGCDMKAGARMMMAHEITEDTDYLSITMRVFVRDGETYPRFYVYVDGNVVRASGSDYDFVTCESDAGVTYIYDLSDYVGETVIIEFYEAASTHTCLQKVELLGATGPEKSTSTSWDRDAFYDEWWMEGSFNTGVGEGVDFNGAGSTAEIILDITADLPYFTVGLRQFVGQDTVNATLGLYVNDTFLNTASGEQYAYSEIQDTAYLWSWDLSSYVGQTVTLKLASFTSSANHCVVTLARLNATDESNYPGIDLPLSTVTSWTGTEFAADTNVTFTDRSYATKNEGADLNGGYSAAFKVALTSELTYLNIGARMYAGQDTSSAYLKVTANGVTIKAVNSDYETFPVPVVDDVYIYTYDLSAYVGKNVAIEITNESSTNHLVLTSVALGSTDNHTAPDNTESYVTSFDFTSSGNGRSLWTISGSNTGVGEGADLQGSQAGSYGSMTYNFAVTSGYEYMKVKGRMFNGQDTSDATFQVTANGTVILPVGSETDATLPCTTDDSSTYYYDLSSYIDTTVTIAITCTSATHHCVIQTVDFVSSAS